MKRPIKKIDPWFFVCVGSVALQGLCYYFTSGLSSPAVEVWIPYDAAIPFLPVFVLFYLFWFAYAVGGLLINWYFHVESRAQHKEFLKFFILLAGGLVLCTVGFIVFPTQIPAYLQPDISQRTDIFSCMVGFIYGTDGLKNAFPSEHCFVAMAVCTGFMRMPNLKRSRHRYWAYPLNILITVGICASTVFIKQHSILDVFGALGLYLILFALIYGIPWKPLQAE
ncbi:MAG: phosphatase PAP2 family protein [Clostridia bacterium]|nr:phosphatase PAP2 family protein [Clostridia bacterium]